jgi:riboflavin synthase
MFTGLVEALGRIDGVDVRAHARRVRVATPLGAELANGDSVAVNGVCLTAVDVTPGGFSADVSPETLRVTTLGRLAAGHAVNLERPLRADARLGGHFVLGHVDGLGTIAGVTPQDGCAWIDVDVPDALSGGVILKGSIAVDGVSLTIASLARTRIGLQIIPFTLAHTTLGAARPGDPVNLEVDVLGKYVARLLSEGRAAGLDREPAQEPV